MKLKNTLGLAIAGLTRGQEDHDFNLCGFTVKVDPAMAPRGIKVVYPRCPLNPPPVERAGLLMHPDMADQYDCWVAHLTNVGEI